MSEVSAVADCDHTSWSEGGFDDVGDYQPVPKDIHEFYAAVRSSAYPLVLLVCDSNEHRQLDLFNDAFDLTDPDGLQPVCPYFLSLLPGAATGFSYNLSACLQVPYRTMINGRPFCRIHEYCVDEQRIDSLRPGHRPPDRDLFGRPTWLGLIRALSKNR